MVELANIPFKIDSSMLLTKLHLDPEGADASRVREMLNEAEKIGLPKGVYDEVFIDKKGENYVVIGGIKFESRILRVNLEEAQRVFPYLVTAGIELMEWGKNFSDLLENYWADVIQELVLRSANLFLIGHIEENYHPGKTASMNPGSLKDWPIQEQSGLFQLLANEKIAVRLTESSLMVPQKSVSGLRFPTKLSFENCKLCSRKECPGRRAPFDRELLEKFNKKTK